MRLTNDLDSKVYVASGPKKQALKASLATIVANEDT